MSGRLQITDELSRRLRAVAFLCACLVVPIHCWSPSAWFAGTSDMSLWEAALAFLLTDTISRCAVPCFFVLSGFFLALKYEPTVKWYRDTLRKRFMTLYVPFVIWNVLYLIRNSFLAHQNLFSFKTIFGYDLFVSPGFGMFWYMQVILVAVLLAPFWLPLVRSRIGAALSVAGLAAAWASGNFGHYFSLQISAGNFLWLIVGAAAAFHSDILIHPTKQLRLTLVILLFLAVLAHVIAGCQNVRPLFVWSDRLTILFGVHAIFANSDLILKLLSPCASIFSLSFFIYAMHPQGLLVHIPLDHLGAPFVLVYLTRIACGVALPIVLGLVLRRFAPRILAILTGGRG